MNHPPFPPEPRRGTPLQRYAAISLGTGVLSLIIYVGLITKPATPTPPLYALIATVIIMVALFVAAKIFFTFFYNMLGIGMIVLFVIIWIAMPGKVAIKALLGGLASYTSIFIWQSHRARQRQMNTNHFMDEELRRLWGRTPPP